MSSHEEKSVFLPLKEHFVPFEQVNHGFTCFLGERVETSQCYSDEYG